MKIFKVSDPFFLPHCGCELQVSLNLGSGIVFVGENGIGKSTLLRRLYSEVSAAERSVVEQIGSEYFYDRKLVSIKKFFLESELASFDQDEFLFLWAAFNLDQKEQRLVSQLSGGESQALKLCLALCKNCPFYFLDEPSQFLDLQRKKILANFLIRLKNRGKTVIVVEHHLDWLPPGWLVQKLSVQNDVLKRSDEWTI
jgi:ABC-type multidrug transport system ATPase subunit